MRRDWAVRYGTECTQPPLAGGVPGPDHGETSSGVFTKSSAADSGAPVYKFETVMEKKTDSLLMGRLH